MNFCAVYITNFLSIGNIDLDLKDRGLVLIQGENADDTSQSSNGSGKSSIPDAICWALYGVTSRKQTADGVVNNIVGKNCEVIVHLTDNGDFYAIARHRKHSKHGNKTLIHKNGNDITPATERATQDLINKIVGCDAATFTSAIYAQQEKMPDLPGMTDAELKVIVEEAAGLTRLSKCHELAKTRSAKAVATLDEARREHAVLDRELEAVKVQTTATRDSYNSWAKKRIKELLNFQHELAETNKKVISPVVIGDSIDYAGEAVRKARSRLDEARLQDVQYSHRELLIKEKNSARDAAILRYRKVANLAKQTKEKLPKIGEPCVTCGRPYTEHELTDAHRALKDQLMSYVNEGKEIQSEIERLAEEVKALSALQVTSDRSVAELVKELSSAEEDLRECERQERENYEYMQYVKRLENEIERLKREDNPFKAMLDDLVLRVQYVKNSRDKASERVAEVFREAELAEEAVEVFGRKGVRSHILDSVTPFLNARTAEYLNALTDGNIEAIWSTVAPDKDGELKEKFGIDVKSKTGAHSFGALSGGEKRKVRLGCFMALQDLFASRSAKPIDLFMADEIDDALDESGLERLMSLLDERARKGGTVLVISHNSLRDWIRESITVRKEAGRTYLEDPA